MAVVALAEEVVQRLAGHLDILLPSRAWCHATWFLLTQQLEHDALIRCQMGVGCSHLLQNSSQCSDPPLHAHGQLLLAHHRWHLVQWRRLCWAMLR